MRCNAEFVGYDKRKHFCRRNIHHSDNNHRYWWRKPSQYHQDIEVYDNKGNYYSINESGKRIDMRTTEDKLKIIAEVVKCEIFTEINEE